MYSSKQVEGWHMVSVVKINKNSDSFEKLNI